MGNNNKDKQEFEAKIPMAEETQPTEDQEVEDLTPKKDAPEEEKVLVDKVTLENIMSRIGELEGRGKKIPPQMRNKTCRVRFYEDGDKQLVVVGYGKSHEQRNADGSRVLIMEVKTEDDKIHEVEFINWNETGKQEVCEILNAKSEEVEVNLGSVFATKVDYDNYRSYETDKEVPLLVKSFHTVYTVQISDGRKIKLDELAVN